MPCGGEGAMPLPRMPRGGLGTRSSVRLMPTAVAVGMSCRDGDLLGGFFTGSVTRKKNNQQENNVIQLIMLNF